MGCLIEMEEGNLFSHTLAEVQKPAPEELVATLVDQMNKMKVKFVHTAKAVGDCLPVLQEKPTVLDVLVVSYILNGSILLKHVVDVEEEEPLGEDDDVSIDIEKMISEWNP